VPQVKLAYKIRSVKAHISPTLASCPGLLTPAFVTCSTSDKRWGKKAWVVTNTGVRRRGYEATSTSHGA